MKECAKCCLDGAVYHITEVNPKKKKKYELNTSDL